MTKRKSVNILFILIQGIMLFYILNTSGEINSIFSLFSISFCAMFTFFVLLINKRSYLIFIAQIFTLCADICLLAFTPQKQILSMIFFSLTQIFYAIYLLRYYKEKFLTIIIRLILIILAETLTLMVLKEKADALSLISLFYFANLISNILFAFIKIRKLPLFAVGLLLFSFCDILVGLSTAIGVYIFVDTNSFIYKLAYPGFNLIWTFYVPSQTLISLSAFNEIK